jgi:hypothetical protein
MRSVLIKANVLSWTLLVILLGYGFGRYGVLVEQVSAPSIGSLRRDVHRRAPIVHLNEINNGSLVGMVGTGARLVIGNTVIVPNPDRTFAIAAGPFLVNVVDVVVPDGALFVASRRGKNYYRVDSSAGRRLVPENRLYFRSAEEAEELGYTPSAP